MRGRLIEAGSIDFNLLRHWLKSCQERHKKCCDDQAAYSVTSLKLIDCYTRKIKLAPPKCRYAALSYVWGPPKYCDAELQHGASLPDKLPKTIEDAITVTKSLRIRYLWLDRYCIPQSDAKERHNQIRQMDLIYSGAYLTIIAAAGQDPDFGLPGVSSTHRIPQKRVHIGKHTLCSLMEDPFRVIRRSPWMSRAWTFQEGLFSRRRLIFTEQQVFYECQVTLWSETVDLERDWLEVNIFSVGAIIQEPEDIFTHIKKYSSRILSYQNDVLNGFLGVFRAFANGKHPVYHYWGVPVLPLVIPNPDGPPESINRASRTMLQSFVRGLCWRTSQPGNRRGEFPSWSWAGWTSEVKYSDNTRRSGFDIHAGLGLISVEQNDGDIKDFDSFWEGYRLYASSASPSKYLHFESWTIPLNLGAASLDPTVVGLSDSGTWSNPPTHRQGNLLILLYLAQQTDENYTLGTDPNNHPLVGIILGDFQAPYPRTYVLVAQQKGDSYECIGHMIFNFCGPARKPVGGRQWSLDIPDKSYAFRHKRKQRIRLG